MRLPLPETAGALWDRLPAKVRNQVRKGQKGGLAVAWGGLELLPEFYAVFSRNMRDLGTPVYGRALFRARAGAVPRRRRAVRRPRAGRTAVAAALLLHGRGVTEVPSASSLRAYNPTNCNMLMYWHLLERAVERRPGDVRLRPVQRSTATPIASRSSGAPAGAGRVAVPRAVRPGRRDAARQPPLSPPGPGLAAAAGRR